MPSPVTILVVDKSTIQHQLIVRAFPDEATLHHAQTGTEALDLCTHQDFDMVFMDTDLSDNTGIKLLRRLRADYPTLPDTAISSSPNVKLISQMMELGISGYLHKPFQEQQLRQVAHSVINGQSAMPMARTGFTDILMIDRSARADTVLKTFLRDDITLETVASIEAARTIVKHRECRVVLIDIELEDATTFLTEVRSLQPTVSRYALGLRDVGTAQQARSRGSVDGTLYKPFEEREVRAFLQEEFSIAPAPPIEVKDNFVAFTNFPGERDARSRHIRKVRSAMADGLRDLAKECYDNIIIDLTTPPPREEILPLITLAHRTATRLGAQLRLVAIGDTATLIQTTSDTSSLIIHESRQEATSYIEAENN